MGERPEFGEGAKDEPDHLSIVAKQLETRPSASFTHSLQALRDVSRGRCRVRRRGRDGACEVAGGERDG